LAHKLFPAHYGFSPQWQAVIFSTFVWILLSILAIIAYKNVAYPEKSKRVEWVIEGLYNLVIGIVGENGNGTAVLGTLFVYIFTMNLFGLFPGMFSSTSKLNTTLALAICVFLYVQFEGIRVQGFPGYIFHLMGSPKSVVEWCLVPLNLPIHIIGELAKPLSLSLRLFGNILGKIASGDFRDVGISSLSFYIRRPGCPAALAFSIYLFGMFTVWFRRFFYLLSPIFFSLRPCMKNIMSI
jgi:F-type H+-transporting ATPase subunit a